MTVTFTVPLNEIATWSPKKISTLQMVISAHEAREIVVGDGTFEFHDVTDYDGSFLGKVLGL
jgi:hypothetical protein